MRLVPCLIQFIWRISLKSWQIGGIFYKVKSIELKVKGKNANIRISL
jgi:hypothetical protein